MSSNLRLILRFFPALVFMVAIFFFSSLPSNELDVISNPIIQQTPKSVPATEDHESATIDWLKVGHFIGYLGLGAVILYALNPFTHFAALFALGAAALYAVSDEFHQTFVPGRHARLSDVLLDTSAACLAILIFYFFKRWKNRKPV